MGLMRGVLTTPAPRRYPLELRERAVRTYRTAEPNVIGRMAEELGAHHETLGNWMRQAEADAGDGLLTTEEKEELARLRREVRELCRANEVLRTASPQLGCLPPYGFPTQAPRSGHPAPTAYLTRHEMQPVVRAHQAHRQRSP